VVVFELPALLIGLVDTIGAGTTDRGIASIVIFVEGFPIVTLTLFTLGTDRRGHHVLRNTSQREPSPITLANTAIARARSSRSVMLTFLVLHPVFELPPFERLKPNVRALLSIQAQAEAVELSVDSIADVGVLDVVIGVNGHRQSS
jgi:hypothetical protein